MTVSDSAALLTTGEPPPFEWVNEGGAAPVLLICDHASRRVPRCLRDLGLSESELARHIGWDIGAAEVTRHMARRLDAPAILSGYSRLVVDCNRHPHDPSLMPAVSDGTAIAANAALAPAERQARLDALYHSYHRAIAARLDRFAATGVAPALLSVHSCTPEMNGRFRPWHIGICWEADRRLAGPVLEALSRAPGIVVGDNQPYSLDAREDYSVPVHAMRRGLPHLQVEFRQDLVVTPEGAVRWAEALLAALQPALAE
ncbi:MAG: N-formylglutamate amidohydrolase [Dongiaceae bacterium]